MDKCSTKPHVLKKPQLLCRILQQWAMPTVGPSPKSKVGIAHFQLLCQFMVGRVPEKWGRCQVEQVSSGSCKSISPPPLQLPHQPPWILCDFHLLNYLCLTDILHLTEWYFLILSPTILCTARHFSLLRCLLIIHIRQVKLGADTLVKAISVKEL